MGRTDCECRQHYLIGQGPGLNKTEKELRTRVYHSASWLWMRCDQPPFSPAAMPSLPRWTAPWKPTLLSLSGLVRRFHDSDKKLLTQTTPGPACVWAGNGVLSLTGSSGEGSGHYDPVGEVFLEGSAHMSRFRLSSS